jgi:hypothetical protein
MTETEILSFLVNVTDNYASHSGQGFSLAGCNERTYLAYAEARRNGYAELRNDRAVITDAGRQRLAQLLGRPIYPVGYVQSD